MNNNNYSTDTQIDRNRGTTALERQVAAQQRNERMSFLTFDILSSPSVFSHRKRERQEEKEEEKGNHRMQKSVEFLCAARRIKVIAKVREGLNQSINGPLVI